MGCFKESAQQQSKIAIDQDAINSWHEKFEELRLDHSSKGLEPMPSMWLTQVNRFFGLPYTFCPPGFDIHEIRKQLGVPDTPEECWIAAFYRYEEECSYRSGKIHPDAWLKEINFRYSLPSDYTPPGFDFAGFKKKHLKVKPQRERTFPWSLLNAASRNRQGTKASRWMLKSGRDA